MSNITLDNVQKWAGQYNMALVVCNDKKPEVYWTGKYLSNGKKEYKWVVNPSLDDLLKAKRIAALHRPQKYGVEGKANIFTVDFDCKEFIASGFSSMFPVSFTIGKEDSSGGIRTTHIEYEIDPKDKPKKLPSYEGSIEGLASTCSVIGGVDRHTIIDMSPQRLSKDEIESVVRMIKFVNFLRECVKVYPPKGTKKRDKFCLRLAGALLATELTIKEKEKGMTALCKVVNDIDELDNRVEKITYVEKDPAAAYSIFHLCEYVGVDNTSPLAKAFDELKPETEEAEEEETVKPQGLTTLTLSEFVDRNYPPIQYYMYPVISDECLGMIFALPGKGKSLYAMELAWRCSQGIDFMDWKFNENLDPPPTLYVEGEMSARQIQDRVLAMTERDRDRVTNIDNFHIAVLKEQPNQNFQKLKTPAGRINVETAADEIYKKTGKKPLIF